MKNRLWSILALVAVLGFAAERSFARGGGHGGGHGGHHGGHHAHHASHHHHNGHHHHSHYAHNGHHGWGNGWGGGWGTGLGAGLGAGLGTGLGAGMVGYGLGAATYGTAAGWLGLNSGYAATDPGTVYTSDSTPSALADTQTAPDVSQVAAAPVEFEPQAEAAARLAANGHAELPNDSKFMPLGVYTIAPPGEGESSATLHLAVSKDGVLRGTYHDALSDQEQTVYGSIDKKTQRVAWHVGPNGKTVFETPLKNLTADSSASVAVHFENGQTRKWNLAHFQDPTTQAEEPKNG